MAIIWQRRIGDTRYEIRSAGATRRLYTNGVCHSQFNPNRVLTGSIWDLLLISTYFHNRERPLRVLVLGVGAGAIIRLLNHFHTIEQIHGVELDPTHLYLAQRFFAVKAENVHLHESDARQWLNENPDSKFDIIIEDLFTEQSKQPVRAYNANSNWYQLMMGRLNRGGILIMNFVSQNEFRQSAAIRVESIRKRFKSIFQLSMPTLDNVVGVYLKDAARSNMLHERLMNQETIRKAIDTKYLRYRIRQQSLVNKLKSG